MRFDGLTVSDVKRGSFAEKAGLEKDDLVVAIGGMSTRYMPLRQAVSKIYHSKKNESLEVTFRINTVIWKEAVR
jgi:C-terminal processing protease CtpA/Prc